MALPSDLKYKRALRVLSGSEPVASILEQINEQISRALGIEIILLDYEAQEIENKLKIIITVMSDNEKEKFMDVEGSRYDPEKLELISSIIETCLRRVYLETDAYAKDFFKVWNKGSKKIYTFLAFQPTYLADLNEKLTDKMIVEFIDNEGQGKIDSIKRLLQKTTIVLKPDISLSEIESLALKDTWKNKYFEILEQNDGLNIISKDDFTIEIIPYNKNMSAQDWYNHYK